jgi:sulfur-carrier protein adenylyltransferase/sulfurtransferase
VFGGGYGGMIARSRPGLDPTPLDARAAINAWCANPEFPKPPKAAVDYGAAGRDGTTMIADDADVAQIAASLTRMAIDALLAAPTSSFESSAYMIGLRKEWIFQGAFDAWPIDLGAPLPDTSSPPSEEDVNKAVKAITGMLPKAAA